MITKNKQKYDVETIAKCLTDTATDEAGATAFRTLMGSDIEISNDYYIPKHAICAVKVKTATEQLEVNDPTCQSGDEPTPPTPDEPRIEGANNISINQGIDFDLTEGVKAYDGDDNEIPFTVDPSEVNKCEVGQQTFTYSAEGVTRERTITIKQLSDPTISGLTELTVEVGEEFDPLYGVTAQDGNGNSLTPTVEMGFPLIFDYDSHGTPLVNFDMNTSAEIGEEFYFDALEKTEGYHISESFTLESIEDGRQMVYTGYCNIFFAFSGGNIILVEYQDTDMNTGQYQITINRR